MIRTILTILLPFLTPFVFYAAWIWFLSRKKDRREAGKVPESWQEWPWLWLVISGSALGLIVLFLLASEGELQEGRWVPPTVVDGELIPGHFEPIPEPVDPD